MISLEEILSIKYPSNFKWSKDGKTLAFIWGLWGVSDLYLYDIPSQELKKITNSSGKVFSYHWNRDGDKIAYNKDFSIYYFDLKENTKTKIITSTKQCVKPQWSPVTDELAFILENNIWLFSNGEFLQITGSNDVLGFSWSPDGKKIAILRSTNGKILWNILSLENQEVLWESEEGLNEYVVWLSEDSFIYGSSNFEYTKRNHFLVDLLSNEKKVIIEESDKKGLDFPTPPVVSHNKEKAVFVLDIDGWPHIWLKNFRNDEEFIQLTRGEFEDIGVAGDSPSWSPNDELIAFSSNRDSKFERHIWTVTLEGDIKKLVDLKGSNIHPTWSPDGKYLAFLHSGPKEVPDLWILDIERNKVKRITESAPKTLENKLVSPKIIEFEGAKKWKVYGSLFLPRKFDETKRYPAIIWLHGGPTRQMVREGYHPSEVYALFYGLNQILAYNGYVVLFIDYRGSMGYGKEFKQGIYNEMGISDVLDVVKAAKYLGSLHFVDENRIGVWGISYGGYLTLQALTKYPGVFKAGINIAGVTNFKSWMKWAEKSYIFAAAFFEPKLGGKPNKNNENSYKEASAVYFVEKLKDKLLNLHGTADGAVVFSQLDELVKELVKKGKDFEVVYYPDEKGFSMRISKGSKPSFLFSFLIILAELCLIFCQCKKH